MYRDKALAAGALPVVLRLLTDLPSLVDLQLVQVRLLGSNPPLQTVMATRLVATPVLAFGVQLSTEALCMVPVGHTQLPVPGRCQR